MSAPSPHKTSRGRHNGFLVLWVLSELERQTPGPHPLRHIAEAAQLDPSNTCKILDEARDRPWQFVSRPRHGYYELTGKGRRSLGGRPGVPLPEPGPFHAFLASLCKSIDQAVVLHYRTHTLGGGMLCTVADHAVGNHDLDIVLEFTAPANPVQTAAGRVMLAHLKPRLAQRLPARERLDPTDVMSIRAQRFAAQPHPQLDGRPWRSLAIPLILDERVWGAVTMFGRPAAQLAGEEEALHKLRSTADQVVRQARQLET